MDEVGEVVVRQLHQDLQYERTQVKELEGGLERERRRHRDIRAEYDHLKLAASVDRSNTSIFTAPSDTQALERELRVGEVQVRAEGEEREVHRLREEVSRLGQELQVEREKGLAGMSAEQLARMRHINSFLEHNLRENGEMLASLGRRQEEKQEMKAANWGLRDRLADCVCSATEERGKSLYGRYLRAESFRKALVWQKRYLVVLLCGEGEGEPVLAVAPPRGLAPLARWRGAIHALVAVSRMKFLVRRWRSGKRAGARLGSTDTPLASPVPSLRGGSTPSLPSPRAPTFGRSHSLRSAARPSTLGPPS